MPGQLMYGFPRNRPQFFAFGIRDLARASASYGYGRNIPFVVRLGITAVIRLPWVRWLVVSESDFAVPCGEDTLAEVLDELEISQSRSIVFYQSEWQSERFSCLIYVWDELLGFLQVRPQGDQHPYPHEQASAFRFPAVKGEALVNGWHARLLEPLPAMHRPYSWNSDVMPEIASQASKVLSRVLPRPEETLENWLPLHGDLTPWNLRVDRRGRLWLIDWEFARWGPPLADLLRYAVTDLTISWVDPKLIAREVSERLGGNDAALREAAEFWLSHPIFAFVEQAQLTEDYDPSLARGHLEAEVLRLLSGTREARSSSRNHSGGP